MDDTTQIGKSWEAARLRAEISKLSGELGMSHDGTMPEILREVLKVLVRMQREAADG